MRQVPGSSLCPEGWATGPTGTAALGSLGAAHALPRPQAHRPDGCFCALKNHHPPCLEQPPAVMLPGPCSSPNRGQGQWPTGCCSARQGLRLQKLPWARCPSTREDAELREA